MHSLRELAPLARALIWKSLREQRRSTWLMPCVFALIFVAFAGSAYFFPGALTGPTQNALREAATRQFGLHTGGRGLELAAALLQGPYLGALMAAYMASPAAPRT